MKTYAVYEIRDQEKLKLVKIDVVEAMTQESARRKAIIGTKKEYDNTRAYPYVKQAGCTTPPQPV